MFTLKDAGGKEHTLADYKGKIVVLQWINPDCPYCVRVCEKGAVRSMRKQLEALDKDIVHLMINSTHYMEAERTAKYVKKNGMGAPGLIDRDGKVGRLYGARTTPHMFVIDKGTLIYGETQGSLLALALSDGREIARAEGGFGFSATPTVSGGYGGALSNGGRFLLLRMN